MRFPQSPRRALARAIGAVIYTAKEAITFPLAELFHLARQSNSHWTDVRAHIEMIYGPDVSHTWQRRFRRAAVHDAYCFLRSYRAICRILIVALIFGLAASTACLVTLFLGAQRQGQFIAASAIVIPISALCALPFVVSGRMQPFRLLVVSAIGTSIGSLSLFLSGTSATIMTILTGKVPSGTEIGAAFLVFAASSAIGAVSSSLALGVVRLATDLRRHRHYPEESAIIFATEIFVLLDNQTPGMPTETKRNTISQLKKIEPCLRGISRKLTLPANSSRLVIDDRFKQASAAVAEYQTWVALEQAHTIKDLRDSMLQLIGAVLTGFYHDLPQPDGPTAKDFGVSRARAWLRGVRQLMTGLLPILVIVALPWFGVALPDPVRQWVTSLALVWFAGNAIALFNPAQHITMRDLLETVRTGGGGKAP
jgi:hypothetical protein